MHVEVQRRKRCTNLPKLNLGLRSGGVQHLATATLPLEKTQYTWVDPRACLDGYGDKEILQRSGFEPRTVQSVAYSYTDYAAIIQTLQYVYPIKKKVD